MYKIKKLHQEEKSKTRAVYETVFQNDTNEFVKYYYSNITKDNDIYVVLTDQNEMISMLHLNPYQMLLNKKEYRCHYIVAVATLESYRRRGLMGEVLRKSLEDMYLRKEPFTYLMPAAEAIYRPYDFETVYKQVHYSYHSNHDFLYDLNNRLSRYNTKKNNQKKITALYIDQMECEELSHFAMDQIGKKDRGIFTVHSKEYLSRLVREQKCQNGGIVVLRENDCMIGYFYITCEGVERIREVVVDDEYDDIRLLIEEMLLNKTHVKRENTKIMIRPVHMESFLNLFWNEKNLDTTIEIRDNIIEQNTGKYAIRKTESGVEFYKQDTNIGEDAITVVELIRNTMKDMPMLLNEIV